MVEDLKECSNIQTPKKLAKRGIIYLSTIPAYMNVTIIREIFGEFGVVGRVYLQLADTESGKKLKKKKFAKKFREGWVEFERKSVAKKVAQILNNQQVSNKKKSKHFDSIWNIKYLPGFKWIHLHERLAYEKVARRQKLRAEVQLAKRKTNFFNINLAKCKKDKQKNNNVFEIKSKNKSRMEIDSTQKRKDFIDSLFRETK